MRRITRLMSSIPKRVWIENKRTHLCFVISTEGIDYVFQLIEAAKIMCPTCRDVRLMSLHYPDTMKKIDPNLRISDICEGASMTALGRSLECAYILDVKNPWMEWINGKKRQWRLLT